MKQSHTAPLPARSGSYLAHLGGVNSTTSTLAQAVQLPTQGPILLRYHYQIRSQESKCSNERAEVRVQGKRLASHNLCSTQATNQWMPATINLSRYAGQTVELQFYLKNNKSLPSSFLIDDLSLASTTLSGATESDEVAEIAVSAPEVTDAAFDESLPVGENVTHLYLPFISDTR